jgi:hypothetical protein
MDVTDVVDAAEERFRKSLFASLQILQLSKPQLLTHEIPEIEIHVYPGYKTVSCGVDGPYGIALENDSSKNRCTMPDR